MIPSSPRSGKNHHGSWMRIQGSKQHRFRIRNAVFQIRKITVTVKTKMSIILRSNGVSGYWLVIKHKNKIFQSPFEIHLASKSSCVPWAQNGFSNRTLPTYYCASGQCFGSGSSILGLKPIQIRPIQIRSQEFRWPKIKNNLRMTKNLIFFDKKLRFTYLQKIQGIGEAFSPQMRTSSTSKHEKS
jgi:hypothetical protein